jgi:Aspartate oxidase
MDIHTDVVIVGCGVAGLYSALKLPRDMQIVMLTKSDAESSDSFLAQGGICVQRDDEDYDSYFEDTMKAGHYENRRESVDIMIRGSRPVIQDLVEYGVRFEQEDGEFVYTREGAHSRPRILFHEDITGKEITGTLLSRVRELPNVTLYEYTAMTDIIVEDGACRGVLAEDVRDIWKDAKEEEFSPKHTLETSITWYDRKEYSIYAKYTILATGGIGGSYQHSTNYPHLTGDAIEIAKVHGIRLENLDYVQIHPTTLYSEKPGRRFLISESVRGEGAVLYNGKKERFVDELLPRDVVTKAIREQMKAEGTDHVWLSMEPIKKDKILKHFPNICQHCLEEGYDVLKEWIPVVPAQHYFMGGIWVDSHSRTSMEKLYAVGETSCNGVHGANRLASNSLLESLVFAGRAAQMIIDTDRTKGE